MAARAIIAREIHWIGSRRFESGRGWRKNVSKNWMVPEAARARAKVSPDWCRRGSWRSRSCSENGSGARGVEGYGMERDVVGWDAEAPWEAGWEAGVAAFGEVSKGEEEPEERGAWGPGVEGIEQREMAKAEIDAVAMTVRRMPVALSEGAVSRRRITDEDAGVGCDQEKAGEDERGEEGEETGVPEFFWREGGDGGGAEAESESCH